MGLITCREAGRRMSMRRDKALESREIFGLLMHLGACRHCRRLQGQMRFLGRAFRTLGRIEEPSGNDGPGAGDQPAK